MLDNIVTCEECDKIFIKKTVLLCPSCEQEHEEKFHIVRTFINEKENYSSTMSEVVEATGVDEGLITRWIKEGRLRVVHLKNLNYECESCGALTNTGRVCRGCASRYQTLFSGIESTPSSIQTYRFMG